MININKYVIVLLLLMTFTAFSQTTIGNYDVLIGGINYEHDMNVKEAFNLGYSSYDGSVYTGNIYWPSLSGLPLFAYAEENGYELVVYSYAGAGYYATFANDYPDVLIVMPAGSNSFELVFTDSIITCPVIVTGAGADTNETGYNIEFHSIDPITNDNLSSFSNGYIAGQILFIAQSLGITIQESRELARMTGSREGIYNPFSGFGKINIQRALSVESVSFKTKYDNDFALIESYPNPFNASCTINIQIENPGMTSINLFNILGEKIKVLDNKWMDNGLYQYYFNGDRLASGIYIITVQTNTNLIAQKINLLK